VTPHLIASPLLGVDDAAARLREDLPPRARVDGDLYLLPYRRVIVMGPLGRTRLDVLSASLGDPRLHGVRLPAVDFSPFSDAGVPAGARLVAATATDEEIRRRAESFRCQVQRLEQLLHFPFWHLRLREGGRVDGAWVDAVEGTVIVHNLPARPAAPSRAESAAVLAVPASAMAALASYMGIGIGSLAAAAGVAALGGVAFHAQLVAESRRLGRRG
jgi:hypothetical protein